MPSAKNGLQLTLVGRWNCSGLEPGGEPGRVAAVESPQREVLLIGALVGVVHVRTREHASQGLGDTQRIRRIHAEEHAATLCHPGKEMGEDGGGQRGRAADWLKKARDLGAHRRESGGLFGL